MNENQLKEPMKIPDAAYLRVKAKELEELEISLAKKILEAEANGFKSIRLDLTYDDGDSNYFGKNKEMIKTLVEAKEYKVEIIPETQLSGGFECYPEYMIIDWS